MADEIAGKAYIELEAKLNNLEASIVSEIRGLGNKSGSTFASSFQTAISPLKGYIASAISVGVITQVGKEVFNLASQVQQAKIAFDKLTGSEEVSIKLLNDIKTFAKTTPFDQMGLVDGAKRLLAYGFTAENVIPIMNSLGNSVSAVGGNQDTLNGVIVALGQMQTKGRLVQQEVNQIAERGIPIFDILKEKLGLTNEQLGDIGNQGITAARAIPLILEGINERFSGIMEEQAKTLQGKYSNMMDVVKITMADIGLSTADGMGDSISSITEFLNENHDQIVQYAGDVLDVVGDTVSVMMDLIQGVGGVIGDVANTGASLIKDSLSDILGDTKDTVSGIKGDWTDLLYYFKLGITTIIGSINVAINVTTSAISGWFDFLQNGSTGMGKVVGGTFVGIAKTVVSVFEYLGDMFADKMAYIKYKAVEGAKWIVEKLNGVLPSSMKIGEIQNNVSYTPQKIDFSSNRDMLKQGASEVSSSWKTSFSGVSDAWNTTTDKMATNLENDYLKRVQGINNKETKDFIKLQQDKIKADLDVYDQKKKTGQKLTKAEEEDYKKRKEFLGDLNKQFEMSSGAMSQATEKNSKKTSEANKAIVENYKDINSAVEKSSKTIEDYQKDIEKVGDKFDDLKKNALKNISDINLAMQDLGVKTDEKLGDRYANIKSDLDKAMVDKKKAYDLANSGLYSTDTLSKISSDSLLANDVKVSDVLEIQKLIEEKLFIEGKVTKELLNQSVAYEKLSESQKILYDKEQELLVLQEKKAINQAFTNQGALDSTSLQIKQTGDAIQAFYEDEQGKLVEIKDIKNIQYAQDLIDKQTSLQQELQLITDKKTVEEGLYKLLSQNKILYEQTYTSALRTEISKQKSLVDELISKYYELNAVKNAGSSDDVSGRRAYGGTVNKGEIYLTGENHHNERFTPYTSGFISPSYDNSKHISVDIGQISSNNPQDFGDWLRSNIGNYL